MTTILSKLAYAAVFALMLLFTVLSSRYFSHDPARFFPEGEFYKDQAAKYLTYYLPFITHIACGLLTMLLGPFLINRRFRDKFLNLHRTVGKVYMIAVVIGASVSFYFTIYVFGGLSPMLAGWVKAIYWLSTTVLAWITIRKKDVRQHRVWILRSYALAIEPVSFKLWTVAAFGFGVSPETVMQVFSWVSAIATVLLMEVYIAKSGWLKPRKVERSMA